MKITKKCVFASRMGLALVGIFLLGQANATVYVLSGDMDVFQALTNPGNVGNGTGTIAGDYDDVTNSLNYTITWMDLTSDVNNMHFHVAPVGVSGPVDLGIPSPWSSPQVGSATLTDTQETNLLSGNWYVNVHTLDFGGGYAFNWDISLYLSLGASVGYNTTNSESIASYYPEVGVVADITKEFGITASTRRYHHLYEENENIVMFGLVFRD